MAPDGDNTTADISILFGDGAKPKTSRPLSTPLLESDAYPNSYLVGLTGIQVDGEDLPIPTRTFDPQDGGVVLSMAIPFTLLDERAYNILKDELKIKIGLPTADGSALGLDLCYTNKSLATAKIPAVALVFDGNNAVMELEPRNYFYMDADTGLECLTILPYPNFTLLGSLIQEGTRMIYDVPGNKLQFEPFQENALPQSDSPRIFSSLLVANFVFLVLVCVLY